MNDRDVAVRAPAEARDEKPSVGELERLAEAQMPIGSVPSGRGIELGATVTWAGMGVGAQAFNRKNPNAIGIARARFDSIMAARLR